MKKNTFKTLLIISAGILFLSSCASQKKYGCPNHISIQKLLGL